MSESQEQMFSKSTKLVYYVLKKEFGFIGSNPEYDEFPEGSYWIFMRVRESFEESKETPFSHHIPASATRLVCI